MTALRPVETDMAFTTDISYRKSFGWLRLMARALFGLAVVLYLNKQLGSSWLHWTALALYVVAQVALWKPRSERLELLAMALDFIAITAVVWFDPAPLPPTLLMFLTLVLSAGLLHGLQRFVLTAILGFATLTALFMLTDRHLKDPAAIYFALAMMALCGVYAAALLWRHRNHEHFVREAAWQDPETGLISRRALLTTAGWLLPLHDRLSQPVTLVLLQSVQDPLKHLADQVSQRIRRSDIAARYDHHTLAMVLPGTAIAAAEKLLHELRAQQPGLQAAMVVAHDGKRSLESILQHLEQHLQRAGSSSGHWLVQATALDQKS